MTSAFGLYKYLHMHVYLHMYEYPQIYIHTYHTHAYVHMYKKNKVRQMFCAVIYRDVREWYLKAKTCSLSGNTFVRCF